MSVRLIGVDGTNALFSAGKKGLLVDTSTYESQPCELSEKMDSTLWLAPSSSDNVAVWTEVAECSLEETVPKNVANRLYTVPKAVSEEAKKALAWRNKHKRGGTQVGLITAKLLANGGQVDIKKVRHVNKFFSAHETDRPEEGWKPGSSDFPNEHRVSWGLWGGNAGWRWARNIAQREDKLTASAELDLVNLDIFEYTDDDDITVLASKVEPHGDTVDTLYTQDQAGGWHVWSNGEWELSDPPERGARGLVDLDNETAVYVAAALYDAPEMPVSLRTLAPHEWDMFDAARIDLDIDMIDSVLTPAALQAAASYTSDERSENASGQSRDATGRFITMGDKGYTKDGKRVTVTNSKQADGSIVVTDETGTAYAYPPGDFTVGDNPPPVAPTTPKSGPLNLAGVLADSTVKTPGAKARLPEAQPLLTSDEIQQVLTDFEEEIKRVRGEKPVRAAGQAPATAVFDPETSDVKPLFLAIVAPDDPQAVMELVALAPAKADGTDAATYKRAQHKWVLDPKILADFRSATPPPVVKLDESVYPAVLSQVDISEPEEVAEDSPTDAPLPQPDADNQIDDVLDENPLVAAGGADRNRGGAETLRRYWTIGPGGKTKIRWRTGGAWTRCYKHLFKYLGPRAAGWCQLRTIEMHGHASGSKEHLAGK